MYNLKRFNIRWIVLLQVSVITYALSVFQVCDVLASASNSDNVKQPWIALMESKLASDLLASTIHYISAISPLICKLKRHIKSHSMEALPHHPRMMDLILKGSKKAIHFTIKLQDHWQVDESHVWFVRLWVSTDKSWGQVRSPKSHWK